jgi:ribosomal protein L11 methyltransferase
MKSRPPARITPDAVLYIYYLEGRLPPQAAIRDDNFIGNWEEEGFSFLFFRCPSEDTVGRLVAAFPPLQLLDSYQMTYAQWQGERVEPVRIGQFWLRPPWNESPPEDGTIEIILDPGVVFGTGTHPTTRDCLQAIARVCANDQITSMLDLGTGTGVLALAAAKLGCRRALAVDCNYLAAVTTLENVRRNQMAARILVINGEAQEHLARPADLLVANIHYDVMQHLVRATGFLDKKWFILSGLLRSDAKRIGDYLANQPVIILERWCRDGVWHTFLGKSRNH